MTNSQKVLVTGASGFVALHCIDQLLKAGHSVRGTLRTMSRQDEVRQALGEPGDALDFVQTDLSSDTGWPQAVADCDYVLHVASPFPSEEPKHEDELITPARDGALRVMRAAKDSGVKRVVMTSSTVAIFGGRSKPDGHIFTEEDWTDVSDKHVAAYPKSKTIAERAAWDFAGKHDGPELVVINPGAVLGPLLGPDYSTSGDIVRLMMQGALPAVPQIGLNMVDVRDVAAAHILAMTAPDAAGQRYMCCGDHIWMSDIAGILSDRFSDEGWKFPSRKLPNFVAKLGAMFNPTLKRIRPMLGVVHRADNAKIRAFLGRDLIGNQEMVIAMADSMIALGVVSKA